MKKKVEKITYFFVDESGDPYFYDRNGNFIVGKEGCSKLLLLGFIKTDQPDILRKSLEEVRKDVVNDSYLKDIRSEHYLFCCQRQSSPATAIGRCD